MRVVRQDLCFDPMFRPMFRPCVWTLCFDTLFRNRWWRSKVMMKNCWRSWGYVSTLCFDPMFRPYVSSYIKSLEAKISYPLKKLLAIWGFLIGFQKGSFKGTPMYWKRALKLSIHRNPYNWTNEKEPYESWKRSLNKDTLPSLKVPPIFLSFSFYKGLF